MLDHGPAPLTRSPRRCVAGGAGASAGPASGVARAAEAERRVPPVGQVRGSRGDGDAGRIAVGPAAAADHLHRDAAADHRALVPIRGVSNRRGGRARVLRRKDDRFPHRVQAAAQINLLLSWNSPGLQGILTSKVFEYLQARVPILALVNGAKDLELEELLQRYSPASTIAYPHDDVQQLKDFIFLHYQNWRAEISPEPDLQKVPDCEGEMQKVFLNEKMKNLPEGARPQVKGIKE